MTLVVSAAVRRRRLALGSLALVASSGAAMAAPAPCGTAVDLSGAPALVQPVAQLLTARGLMQPAVGCPAAHVELVQGPEGVLIRITRGGEPPIEQTVDDVALVATVIESWVRQDVAAPLLAVRPLPLEALQVAPIREAASVVATAPAADSPRGVQLFATFETTQASDHTTWGGVQLGACVMLGPVCAAARIRFAQVITGPGQWHEGLERRGVEVLLGGDIPMRLGPVVLAPGFGAGVGSMLTRLEGPHGSDEHVGMESSGLRADFHAALSWPIRRRLALDLALAFDFTQTTDEHEFSSTTLPDEPGVLMRIGAGVRYGGL